MQAIHIEPYGQPEEHFGGFYDEKTKRLLPFTTGSAEVAIAFISACERVGIEADELDPKSFKLIFDLWHDAFKRPT